MSRNRQKLHPTVAEAVLEVAAALRDGSLAPPALAVAEPPAPEVTTVRRLSVMHAGRFLTITGADRARRLAREQSPSSPAARVLLEAPEVLSEMGRLVGFEASPTPADGMRGLVLQQGSRIRVLFVPLGEVVEVAPADAS